MSFLVPLEEAGTKPPHFQLHEQFMGLTDIEKQAHFFKVDEKFAGQSTMCVYCSLSGPRVFILSHIQTCGTEYFRVNRNVIPELKKQKIEETQNKSSISPGQFSFGEENNILSYGTSGRLESIIKPKKRRTLE